jgi:lipoprotein-anchoring transpeptidase ErfK/SrfK
MPATSMHLCNGRITRPSLGNRNPIASVVALGYLPTTLLHEDGVTMILRAVACLPWRSLGLCSAALITSLLVFPAPPAVAQSIESWFGSGSPYPRRVLRTQRHSVSKRLRETDDKSNPHPRGKESTVAETKPTGPLFAILSLSNQHISVYNSSGLVTRSKVSTGMPGHRTPMGIFTILGRERYHSSNIYSGAPMPFMQRITWSGVAMHLGVVPGYPASHGCIRLPAGSAERMWGLTKVGERVVIAPHEVAPLEFAHPLLPVPKMQPSPVPVADATPPKATEVAAAGNDPVPLRSRNLLNPYEYAQALKSRATADIAAAVKSLQERGKQKEATSDAVRRAISELRAAETARSQAEAKLALRTEALATKRDGREVQRAQTAKAAADSLLSEAGKKLQTALDNPAFTTPEGNDALAAERKLMEIRTSLAAAQATAKETDRRMSPISILVSKKDNKVYVRQALAPILEAPIAIKDGEKPLGTHVYIATSQGDGSTLGWTVVSYPTSRKGVDETSSRNRRDAAAQVKSTTEPEPSSPAFALERVQFPAEVSALIAERLWTGGSIIITDESLSDETSDTGTDLVVTMRYR